MHWDSIIKFSVYFSLLFHLRKVHFDFERVQFIESNHLHLFVFQGFFLQFDLFGFDYISIWSNSLHFEAHFQKVLESQLPVWELALFLQRDPLWVRHPKLKVYFFKPFNQFLNQIVVEIKLFISQNLGDFVVLMVFVVLWVRFAQMNNETASNFALRDSEFLKVVLANNVHEIAEFVSAGFDFIIVKMITDLLLYFNFEKHSDNTLKNLMVKIYHLILILELITELECAWFDLLNIWEIQRILVIKAQSNPVLRLKNVHIFFELLLFLAG